MGYIILYGGLLSIIVTVISVWISDGFFYALIAGVVSFFVWGLVVGVADKLGMLPDEKMGMVYTNIYTFSKHIKRGK